MRAFARSVLCLALIILAAHPAEGADGDAQKRTLSANRAQIQRFMNDYNKTKDASRRSQLMQKISVLSQANESILDGLAPEPASQPPVEETAPVLLGADWLQMSQGERENYVYSFVGDLEKEGVFLMKPSARYLSALNEELALDQSWEQKPLSNLFIYTVFNEEPQARPALKRFSSIPS